MPISLLRTAIIHTAKGFPLATPRIARRQAARLLRARAYLVERGLYKRAT